jgi:ADP-ribose pyrophosphatase
LKKFTKVEPSVEQLVGLRYKKAVTIKKFRTEDGLEHEFTTFSREGARAGGVIALTSDKKVVTTYQFRAGPEQWMYELPGGGFKKSEDPKVGALRELEEETGYTAAATSVKFLGTCFGDAYTNCRRYYFLATDCKPGQSKLDVEEIEQGAEIRLISIDELIENAKTDQMTDPAAVLMAYDKLMEIKNDESN